VASLSAAGLSGALLEFRASTPPETVMGKYLLAWILGVPAFVLVIAYFFFH